MQSDEAVTIAVNADTSGFQSAMAAARRSAVDFTGVFSNAISGAVKSGKGFEAVLRTIALRLSDMALKSALAPVEKSLSSVMNNFLGGAVLAGAAKGVAPPASPIPFARGGVVNGPALFAFSGGTGLMGEAGPEAVMPLARDAHGRLGVSAGGTGGLGAQHGSAMNIVFNVQTNDAASFKRSEGQLTAMLARAVQRGQRQL